MTASARLLGPAGIVSLIDLLRRDGRLVVGPTVRDGVITLAPIEGVADLPGGWADEQAPGHYRAAAGAAPGRLFAHASPALPWKRWFQAESTLLVRARTTGGGLAIEVPPADDRPLALFGISACDLAGLERFRTALAGDPHVDARADVVVVTVACTAPAATCFCTTTGTGPVADDGYDLALTELAPDDGRPRVLARFGSERGAALLSEVSSVRAGPVEVEEASAAEASARAAMPDRFDPRALRATGERHPAAFWEALGDRCLACGNCTMVCPTCFCSRVDDTTSPDLAVAERWRHTDSCFDPEFSLVHRAPVRASIGARYRQWFLHKFVTWYDQFDTAGCVGCGRCVTWCPVGIDVAAEAAARLAVEGASP